MTPGCCSFFQKRKRKSLQRHMRPWRPGPWIVPLQPLRVNLSMATWPQPDADCGAAGATFFTPRGVFFHGRLWPRFLHLRLVPLSERTNCLKQGKERKPWQLSSPAPPPVCWVSRVAAHPVRFVKFTWSASMQRPFSRGDPARRCCQGWACPGPPQTKGEGLASWVAPGTLRLLMSVLHCGPSSGRQAP